MNNLKFRVWHKEKKVMYKVGEIHFLANQCLLLKDPFELGDFEFGEFNEIELMQFTGLQDKNGKDIYEGDILETNVEMLLSHAGYGEVTQRSKVIFQDCCFSARLIYSSLKKIKYEESDYPRSLRSLLFENGIVVGNIHENHELLQNEEGIK